jgi:hypothetical protein
MIENHGTLPSHQYLLQCCAKSGMSLFLATNPPGSSFVNLYI